MLRKQWTTLCLAVLLLTGIAGKGYAEQTPKAIDIYYLPLQFIFDGELYAPPEDQQGFIYEGSAYVPLRFISYALNRAVRWDGAAYTVYVQQPDDSEKLEIQEYNLNTKVHNGTIRATFDAAMQKPSNVSVYKEEVQYIFNGEAAKTGGDVSGLFFDNRLYVPLRFFSESVGRTIRWDPVSYTISAESKVDTVPKAPEPPKKTEPEPPPKEANPPSVPPTGGGGSGGGSPSGGGNGGNTAAQLQADAESKLRNLENSCRNKLMPLAEQYFNENDPAKKKELISKGTAILSECTGGFNSIIAVIQGKVPDEVIESYRAHFDQVQNDALAELLIRRRK